MAVLLQINVVVNSGSTGKITEEVGTLAISQGWKSFIAYGRGKPKSNSQLLKIGNNWDMYIHGIQTRFLDNHGLSSVNATKKLIEEIKCIKPDIIHLHNIHGYYVNYEILFNFLATLDTPIVWTLHDCWSMTGHCSHFDAIGCNKWQNVCYDCPLKKDYPTSFLMDSSKRNFKLKKKLFSSVKNMTIVSVSRWLANIVKKSYLTRYPVKIINNGIDLDVFKPRNSELRSKHNINGKFVLIGVATVWNSMKGFDDFISLAHRLPEDCCIILIGLTKKQKKKLPNNIIGIARTENQVQLAEYYSMADVVMNLSYQETFGMTTIEGFACGTPGIVYDRTASPELISEETGVIVKAANISEVLDAVEKIKCNTKKYYSEACRERAIRLYDKKERYREYMKLYNELLGFKQITKT